MATGGWISVADRMPPDGKVIVHCPSGDPKDPFITMAWYHAEEGEWSLLPEYWIRAIRHWMPLPEPPPGPGPAPKARRRKGANDGG